MCGLCRSQNILSLMETTFTSIADVFACFSTPPCSWKPLLLACETIRREPDKQGIKVKCDFFQQVEITCTRMFQSA